MHGHACVHRDIKLENIMFSGNDVLKLIDFGLAAEIRGTRKLDLVCGSLLYVRCIAYACLLSILSEGRDACYVALILNYVTHRWLRNFTRQHLMMAGLNSLHPLLCSIASYCRTNAQTRAYLR